MTVANKSLGAPVYAERIIIYFRDEFREAINCFRLEGSQNPRNPSNLATSCAMSLETKWHLLEPLHWLGWTFCRKPLK